MDFRQALEHLSKAGVDFEHVQESGSQKLAERVKRLLQANDLAANYYQHSLPGNHMRWSMWRKRVVQGNCSGFFGLGMRDKRWRAGSVFDGTGFKRNERVRRD